jgi:hypothetical protein
LTELGRLLDTDALAGDGGPRAKTRISVPPSWSDESALVEIRVPRTLACARCDGGGCDGCGRSGALRGPAKDAARVVRVRLPQNLRDGVAMRIADPFGRAAPIAQLWIEVVPAKEPSATVRRIGGPKVRRRILPRMVAGLSLLVVLVAGVLALLTWARR